MYNKGAKHERELLEMFWKEGFAVVRSAGSGKTRHPNPDLVVSNGKRFYAIECKSSKMEVIVIPGWQVEELEKFSRIFGAEAVLAIRFNHSQWRFLRPEQMERTGGGNFKTTRTHSEANGALFEETAGKWKQERLA